MLSKRTIYIDSLRAKFIFDMPRAAKVALALALPLNPHYL